MNVEVEYISGSDLHKCQYQKVIKEYVNKKLTNGCITQGSSSRLPAQLKVVTLKYLVAVFFNCGLSV